MTTAQLPDAVDILVVGEQYREDGLDRSSVVMRALEFLLDFRSLPRRCGRDDLTPERIAALIARGCFVVCADFDRGAAETPKVHAALTASRNSGGASPIRFVLPLPEAAVHAESCSLEEAALDFVEWLRAKQEREAKEAAVAPTQS